MNKELASISLRDLEWQLQEVEGFKKPKVKLEQYATSAHLAAQILYTAQSRFNDLANKLVADFGCGTGMLTCGASLLDSAFVVGVDCDADALAMAKSNIENLNCPNVELVCADVFRFAAEAEGHANADSAYAARHDKLLFDTVIMNPPFGTKRDAGADVRFIEAALLMTTDSGIVYSLHKSSTRPYLSGKFAKTHQCEVQVLAEQLFALPRTFHFHREQSVDIHVDLLRIRKLPKV